MDRRLSEIPKSLNKSPQREPDTLAVLRAQLEAQAAEILELQASISRSRKIFDNAFAAAKIGVWECNLADEALQWTDVVYDIFGLPRRSPLDRQQLLKCYSDQSAMELALRRSRAIDERDGFNMDAEIVSADGRHRWIRITATVESEDGVAVRIFGMKQDITEEKILADRTKYLAEFDVMTGLANRSQFQSKLAELYKQPAESRSLGALLLVDLDAFKAANDTFGHAAGDDCLIEVGLRLRTLCGEAELVARIGGDEFAVLLGSHLKISAVTEMANLIVEVLRRPINGITLGASVGIALFDSCAPSQLFMNADIALYAAKAAGRNTFRLFNADLYAQAKDLPPGHDSPHQSSGD